jgi:excinuclease ABC subunit B
VQKAVQDSLAVLRQAEETESLVVREAGVDYDVQRVIADLEREMVEAAEALEFERAAMLRDQLYELKQSKLRQSPDPDAPARPAARYVISKRRRSRGRK